MQFDAQAKAEAEAKYDLLREEMIMKLHRVDRQYINTLIVYALLLMRIDTEDTSNRAVVVSVGCKFAELLDQDARQFTQDMATTMHIMEQQAKAGLAAAAAQAKQ